MSDTGPAKLPGLPAVQTSDAALQRWIQAVAERLEVREGARGNPMERVVTQRELDALKFPLQQIQGHVPRDGDLIVNLGGGGIASIEIQKFIDYIKSLQLYKDLIRRLDDPHRFDDLPERVRNILLKDIAEEAAKRGADIQRLDYKVQGTIESLAYTVQEVTASVQGASAGVRDLTFAYANSDKAQAGFIKQATAALTGYYPDGTPGKASLEIQGGVTADRYKGLMGQYTVKINAGKAVAGFGLAATEEVNGTTTSAFIIQASKFAFVSDDWNGDGKNTANPDINTIPFGIDTSGPVDKIFMQGHVYLKGAMLVDGPTGSKKPLINGLRGSLNMGYDASWTNVWSDSLAEAVICNEGLKVPQSQDLLVIGDTVTLTFADRTAITKMWNGSSWTQPGFYLNGDMIVDGTVAAKKINTNGLDIRDAKGKVVFSSGVDLDLTKRIPGLGALAKADSATIGSTVSILAPDPKDPTKMIPTVLKTSDFVNSLSKISAGNISSFMSDAAIGNAYIGNAAIKSANIDSLAVTTAKISDHAVSFAIGDSKSGTPSSVTLTVPFGTYVDFLITATANVSSDGLLSAGAGVYQAKLVISSSAPGAPTVGNDATATGSSGAGVCVTATASIKNWGAGTYTFATVHTIPVGDASHTTLYGTSILVLAAFHNNIT